MRLRHALLSVLLALPATAHSDQNELNRLVTSQQYAQAYALGRSLLAESAGDPRFDFNYGLAALEAGQPQEAVLALERAVLAQPSNHRARLELARALFAVGDYERSKRHFERVLAADPPDSVAAKVQGFLDAIDRRQKAVGTGIDGAVSLAFGYDSNINSATAAEQILVFGLPFRLSGQSREIDSAFAELDAQLNLRKPLSKTQGLFGQLAYRHRGNFETDDFDLDVLGLAGGYGFSDGPTQWRFPLQVQVLLLSGEHFRSLGSLGAEWTRAVGANQEVSLFGQAAATDYPDASERDATLLLAGGGWSYRLAGTGATLVVTVFGGDEDARQDYNGRRFVAGRLAAIQPVGAEHVLSAAVTAQEGRYQGEAPVFGIRREDSSVELQAAWNWHFVPEWVLRTQASWIDNQSNLDIYEYDRVQAQVGLGYVFK